MNIIIPLGGKGIRFQKNGFNTPKPLIKIFDKEMIFYVLDNLKFSIDDKIFIIYYNVNSDIFENMIKSKYPNIYFIELKEQTKGAAETIYNGLQHIMHITNHKKTMLLDCDTFYTEDVISLYRNIDENAVFYVKNNDTKPIFSYINLGTDNIINQIAEKIKISDNANTGIYCFRDIQELYQYSKIIVSENITFNNECYTSCIIDYMIKEKHKFIGIQLTPDFVFNLGTPIQLDEYIKNTYAFLFDLDGTIVLTDTIYYDIWKKLLSEYGIDLTPEIFKNNISGNNDTYVVNSLLINKNVTINELSKKKDELFLNNINSIKLIPGIDTCLRNIKNHGHKLCMVTNCNRIVAENIVDYLKLDNIFDFIIIGNECNNPKPYPDPYIEAMRKLNITNEKTIIFEDSKSGLLSASGTNPKCIIGIETYYSSEELIKYNANITIKNFESFNFNKCTHYNNVNIQSIKKMIKDSLIHINIQSIYIYSNKLKGGFISDVLQIEIITNLDEKIHCVLKMENSNETFLSTMSNELDLYNREYYFYDTISKYIPIKFPKPYGLIKDENFNNIGVLLENLNTEDYKLNLDLNNECIDVSFKVIESLALLHSKFWNKPINNHFKELKKNTDIMFQPSWNIFIHSRWDIFKSKWFFLLSKQQLDIGQYIVDNFNIIQEKLSDKNLTFCHGDVKSANIFYKFIKSSNTYEPYFIDWQYIIHGKGVQDLVFFMIESFESDKMKLYKTLFKEYYYIKLVDNGINNYSKNDYEEDFKTASYYFPFFVAIWFGTMNEEELIDKNFPLEYIKKLFDFYIS